MRRWDRLLDSYIEEYRNRGVIRSRWPTQRHDCIGGGRWPKGRRPRVGIERIDAEMITH